MMGKALATAAQAMANFQRRTPARKRNARTDSQEHHRGAEIRLPQDKHGGHDGKKERWQQIERPAHLLEIGGMEIAGERQRKRNLHQL